MKKQGVIDKMKGFFEKYFGIGGSSTFVESNHKVVTYDMSEQENLPMVAEPKMPYGEQLCEHINAKMVVSAVAFEKTVITYSPHKWGGVFPKI